ncbi:MAG: hypothetical protein V4510_07235 [bacterium]
MKLVALACFALATAASAGCTGHRESQVATVVMPDAAAPDRTVGDSWHESEIETNPQYNDMRDDAQITVMALENWTVLGTTYAAARVQTDIDRQPGDGTHTAIHSVKWQRVSDDANLEERSSAGGPPQTRVYSPPCPDRHWPLRVGAAWTDACTLHDSRGPAAGWHVQQDAHVVGSEMVSVPAGTFAAFKIVTEISSWDTPTFQRTMTTWYAPAACGPVRTVWTDASGNTSTTQLLDFRCVKPVSRAAGL